MPYRLQITYTQRNSNNYTSSSSACLEREFQYLTFLTPAFTYDIFFLLRVRVVLTQLYGIGKREEKPLDFQQLDSPSSFRPHLWYFLLLFNTSLIDHNSRSCHFAIVTIGIALLYMEQERYTEPPRGSCNDTVTRWGFVALLWIIWKGQFNSRQVAENVSVLLELHYAPIT